MAYYNESDDARMLALLGKAQALDSDIDGLQRSFDAGAGVGPLLGETRKKRAEVRDAIVARQQELAAERTAAERRAQAEEARVAEETLAANKAMASNSREAALSSADAARAAKRAALWTLVAAVVSAAGVGIQAWQTFHARDATRPSATSPSSSR